MYAIIEPISTILNTSLKVKKPLVLALFLLTGLLLGGRTWFLEPGAAAQIGVSGGPEMMLKEGSLYAWGALKSPTVLIEGAQSLAVSPVQTASLGIAMLKDVPIVTADTSLIPGTTTYRIRSGDTLSKIAKAFGVTQATILSANPAISAKKLRPGVQISILSAGARYKVKDGETAQSVAATFGLGLDELQTANRTVDFNSLESGATLMIPGHTDLLVASTPHSSLPAMPGYFKMPADGLNWGILHNYNAVDIANNCGAAVHAAAEGLVVFDENFGDGSQGWNGGYGHFVLVEHPNGTKTRYAHLDAVSVHVGDYLSQGQMLGTMGNTGNVHGPTGCHLHFEVYGAQNPFAKK